MLEPLGAAIVVFCVVFLILEGIEYAWHRLMHNPDHSYQWGVWLFSVLAAVFTFINDIGR
jgi:predicted tellurium resistance membrane protein TerC